MSLSNAISNASRYIQGGRLKNEQQVRNSVILPIFRALGWDTTDPDQVFPEYGTETGRVDYALLGEDGTPLILIETKALGNVTDKSIRQLFRYAFDAGGGIIVLTDGQKWEFYLAEKAGVDKRDRIFCKLDLTQTQPDECQQKLSRYLDRGNTYKGVSFEYARKDFETRRSAEKREQQEKQERDKLRTSLPSIWEGLRKDQKSPLYELMARAIANAGLKGYPEVLAEFISRLGSGQVSPTNKSTPRRPQASYVSEQSSPTPQQDLGSRKSPARTSVGYTVLTGYTLDGVQYDTEGGPETMRKLFSALITRDHEFVSNLKQSYPKWFGEKRKFIADSPEEVYQNIASYGRASAKLLENGQYIDTSFSFRDSVKRIKKSCEVTNLQYGTDLILHSKIRPWKSQK